MERWGWIVVALTTIVTTWSLMILGRNLARAGERIAAISPVPHPPRLIPLLAPPAVLALSTATVIGFGVWALRVWLGKSVGRAGGASISAALGQLLLLTGAAGIVAFLAVEFVKRQTPLREIFQRLLVDGFFGVDINALNEAVTRHLMERGKGTTLRDRPGGGPSDISYAATSRQLAGQLADSLRYLAVFVPDPRVPDKLRHALTFAVIGDPRLVPALYPADYVKGELVERAELASSDELAAGLTEHIERRIDAFQILLENRWQLLIQALAATLAGLLAAAGTSLGTDSAVASAVGTISGLVIGGPIAWLCSDLVRIVRRGAAY
ncbi:hypothetical protein [Nocardia pseudobrasiliensis]|uniref:Uncharacterized protein n=1 Tax=Nocardia pseudobrasiliensis TaxID=45979 RepID=A0A370HY82_9NOCA|nr:hypothetical protein [Nocardia pseudobrasiliensis]RDI63473.1 hypothetical protein DFR76_110170 [Nocardia pseudobrasiliensis]